MSFSSFENTSAETDVEDVNSDCEDGSDVGLIIGTARISAEVSLGRAVISHY